MTKDEIKAGDRINTPKGMGTVHCACGGWLTVKLDNGEWWVNIRTTIPEKENKPTDEIKCGDRVQTWLSKHKSADHNGNAITIPVKADLDDTYWDAYKAELAKELAVKLANEETITSPATADYITDFATRIVDNLKKQSE